MVDGHAGAGNQAAAGFQAQDRQGQAALAATCHNRFGDETDIFLRIQKRGRVDDKEIYRTLNMGIGMVIVLAREDAEESKYKLRACGVNSYFIGEVTRGDKDVIIKE